MPQPPGPREVLSADDVRRALTRIAHEVAERNHGTDHVVVVGLQRGGVWIARLLADTLTTIGDGRAVPVGSLDVSFHRDDAGCGRSCPAASPTSPSTWTVRPSSSSTTCCSPDAPCAPRWRRSTNTGARSRCSWR